MFVSLLLFSLVCIAKATHFYGTMMTYYPKTTHTNGSVEVVLRYKLNFHSCTDADSWTCLSGDCGTQSLELHKVEESSGEWCQREGVMTRQVPSNAAFQLVLDGGNWISGILNGIIRWRAVTLVELRNRSDTGQANRSPQTTILPALRVPSNCQRDFHLLAFDPDGDVVKCRNGITSLECDRCTPPSVLQLLSSCSLLFRPTNSSNEGPYAVQLVMEDFPRQNITLTQTNGIQQVKTTNDPISKIPLQFVLRVDDAVPSCTEGLYLPKFLPPTPANRAQLYASVNQTLDIHISAEANNSRISELLFSGPYNVIKSNTTTGQFTLQWTPSESEDGESHPICFVVESVSGLAKYHSELRCVIVSVGNPVDVTAMTPNTTNVPSTAALPSQSTTAQNATPSTVFTTPATIDSNLIVAVLRVRISSSYPLSDEDIRNIVSQIKDELVRRGLPSDITVRFVRNLSLESSTSAPPAGTT
ncbi:uncharacterized protein LOC121504333 [Cheilinus undulatus]|uniref:uncharacterized protein LOC121504333 n=1 Tax=Cheilinus undulatus TaxID=241271 RepID=UPI001BD2BE4D|nr:uncharacterized protein LOC121504333 [Cheilinus undulatus]